MTKTINLLCDILLILCIIQLIFTSIFAFAFGNVMTLINCKFVNSFGVITALVTIPVIFQIRNELGTALNSKTYGKTIWYQRYALCMCIILYSFSKLMAVQTLIRSSEHARISEFSKLTKNYLETTDNKKLIDHIQTLLHCCGANNYTDWFKYDWTLRNFTEKIVTIADDKPLDLEDYSIQYNYNNYNVDNVPFSCCSVLVVEPCQHDDLQMHGINSINSRGCGRTLEELSILLITVELICFTLALLLQAGIMISLRRTKFSLNSSEKSDTFLKSILKKTTCSETK